MSDMRKSDKNEYVVLLYIIQQGKPTAAYEIAGMKKMNQPTVWNVCNRLKRKGQLAKQNGSRNKLM